MAASVLWIFPQDGNLQVRVCDFLCCRDSKLHRFLFILNASLIVINSSVLFESHCLRLELRILLHFSTGGALQYILSTVK